MGNVYLGIGVILIVIVLYYYSWKKYSESMFTLALFLIISAGFLLRVYTSLDFYLHPWDERYHALVAKNLILHPFLPTLYDTPILDYDYKVWISNNVWLHKPPFALWLISLSLKVFGLSEFAVRIPSIILSTFGIIVVYKLADELFIKRIAFIAAFLFSIHGLIIELTAGRVSTDHVDISFMFLILLSVYLSVLFAKYKKIRFNLLAGFVLGLAVLTKLYAAFIVVPIWFAIVLNYRNFSFKEIALGIIGLIAISSLVFLPWIIYINIYFPDEVLWESHMSLLHFTKVVEERTGPLYFHFDNMRLLFGEGVYLAIIWLIYRFVKTKRNFNYMALLIWVFIPYLVFTLAVTKMQTYIMIAAPALFITTALFIDYLLSNIKSFKYKWVVIIAIIILIGLPIRYSIERIKPFTVMERNPEWAEETRNIAQQIDGKNAVLFGYDRPIEAMFYGDGIVYSGIPDLILIKSIKEDGFNVFVYNKNDGTISPF